jgi:hypothetical protein
MSKISEYTIIAGGAVSIVAYFFYNKLKEKESRHKNPLKTEAKTTEAEAEAKQTVLLFEQKFFPMNKRFEASRSKAKAKVDSLEAETNHLITKVDSLEAKTNHLTEEAKRAERFLKAADEITKERKRLKEAYYKSESLIEETDRLINNSIKMLARQNNLSEEDFMKSLQNNSIEGGNKKRTIKNYKKIK